MPDLTRSCVLILLGYPEIFTAGLLDGLLNALRIDWPLWRYEVEVYACNVEPFIVSVEDRGIFDSLEGWLNNVKASCFRDFELHVEMLENVLPRVERLIGSLGDRPRLVYGPARHGLETYAWTLNEFRLGWSIAPRGAANLERQYPVNAAGQVGLMDDIGEKYQLVEWRLVGDDDENLKMVNKNGEVVANLAE